MMNVILKNNTPTMVEDDHLIYGYSQLHCHHYRFLLGMITVDIERLLFISCYEIKIPVAIKKKKKEASNKNFIRKFVLYRNGRVKSKQTRHLTEKKPIRVHTKY